MYSMFFVTAHKHMQNADFWFSYFLPRYDHKMSLDLVTSDSIFVNLVLADAKNFNATTYKPLRCYLWHHLDNPPKKEKKRKEEV